VDDLIEMRYCIRRENSNLRINDDKYTLLNESGDAGDVGLVVSKRWRDRSLGLGKRNTRVSSFKGATVISSVEKEISKFERHENLLELKLKVRETRPED